MLVQSLYLKVLIEPAIMGADRLQIVTGYATAAMAHNHLAALRDRGLSPKIDLIVGMVPVSGIERANHEGFKKISAQSQDSFQCRYVVYPPGVHSKVFLWSSRGTPTKAFLGSANYSQRAFQTQWEAMAKCSALDAHEYFTQLETRQSLPCTESQVLDLINIFDGPEKLPPNGTGRHRWEGLVSASASFLTKGGTVPERSGLNWGQRNARNRDEAYISLSSYVYNTDFFPPVGNRFTVLTDDGEVLICTRVQANGKAIVTPENNSLLGRYFRQRIGVPSHKKVARKHLDRYGRSSVTFYKVDDETYYMDFASEASAGAP